MEPCYFLYTDETANFFWQQISSIYKHILFEVISGMQFLLLHCNYWSQHVWFCLTNFLFDLSLTISFTIFLVSSSLQVIVSFSLLCYTVKSILCGGQTVPVVRLMCLKIRWRMFSIDSERHLFTRVSFS